MNKRLFDFFIALLVLIALSPLLFVVSLLSLLFMGRPIFFHQIRPGKDGKPFKILKFRTMKDNFDSGDSPLPDSLRLTKFGSLLRKTSIDELPSFINVLKGEMSLVGPRPLLMEYLDLYTARQKMRHKVLPGITGWAQVNGRNQLSWKEKFELDVWYVENQNFMLDLKILFLTFLKVIKREGISSKTHVTMEKFTGDVGEK